MEKNNMVAYVATIVAFFTFLIVAVVQVQSTNRAKISAGYVEQYVPYQNQHVWTK